MTKKPKRKRLPDIHEHPIFRTLVDDLKKQEPERVDVLVNELEEQASGEQEIRDGGSGD